MKAKKLIILLVAVAICFASSLSVFAIGFEAEKAYESVFVIYSGSSLGSGFALGPNCIVTNAHVISNPRRITVSSYGGKEYRAQVLGMDENADIAVLIVEDANFPYLSVAALSEMKTGDDIYAIGAPKGMAYTLTKGGISAKERTVKNQTYIQIDAPINEGNSGGPLLNDAGQVLGMNTLKMTDSEGLGLAIPIDRVCAYMKSLGISLNQAGNVPQDVTVPEQEENRPAPDEKEPDRTQSKNHKDEKNNREKENGSVLVYLLLFALALSLGVNVALAVLLIKAKQAQNKKFDPSERTDFEIELLE